MANFSPRAVAESRCQSLSLLRQHLTQHIPWRSQNRAPGQPRVGGQWSCMFLRHVKPCSHLHGELHLQVATAAPTAQFSRSTGNRSKSCQETPPVPLPPCGRWSPGRTRSLKPRWAQSPCTADRNPGLTWPTCWALDAAHVLN